MLASRLYLRELQDMDVRLLREPEIEEVIAIWHDARKETHTSIGIEAERGVTLEDSRQIFRELIASRCGIWVAEREEGLLGFLAIRGSYIDRMYVRPEAQRTGVGTTLLDKARELSPSGLELHTHQENHGARNFYEKHGFRAVAFGVSPPPENEPDVEYWWRPAWPRA
jgi:ribosomal protein S18 acetylase RimI-like enzyme